MNFSNFTKETIRTFQDDQGNLDYFSFNCTLDNTQVMIKHKKEANQWALHFVSHAHGHCDYCGEVELYSRCPVYTELSKLNYIDLLSWFKYQLRSDFSYDTTNTKVS